MMEKRSTTVQDRYLPRETRSLLNPLMVVLIRWASLKKIRATALLKKDWTVGICGGQAAGDVIKIKLSSISRI
jgi:hypothetical protein